MRSASLLRAVARATILFGLVLPGCDDDGDKASGSSGGKEPGPPDTTTTLPASATTSTDKQGTTGDKGTTVGGTTPSGPHPLRGDEAALTCPWDAAIACTVVTPEAQDPQVKVARMTTPAGARLARMDRLAKRFPGRVRAVPELPQSAAHGAGPALAPTNGAGPALAPTHGGAAHPAPHPGPAGTLLVPVQPPHTPGTSSPLAPVHPSLTAAPGATRPFLGVAPGVCAPDKMFMCVPDRKVVAMSRGSVSTFGMAVIDFTKEYDECAKSKGKPTVLSLLREKTMTTLKDAGYGRETPSLAPLELSIEAWKGTRATRELDFLVRQTLREEGIEHTLYFPTDKEPFRAEMQSFIEKVRVDADLLMISLWVTGDCPP
ncbi:MAG: hypothetical protein R3B70_30145 [Polyangiaceae bacterium]